jgi:cysteine desulfurase family protein
MIYFNNAATTYPKPDAVIDAVTASLRHPPSNPYRENVNEKSTTACCRERLATLFGFKDPDRVILSSGATEALNIAIHGLLEENDHVVTTQIEHNAVLRPLYQLRDTRRISLDIVACKSPGKIDPDQIKQAIKPNTRLVIVNHASNVTGVIQDIQKIYRICRQSGIRLLVDVSQSAGAVSIDTSAMPEALFAFTGHKSLFGPPGTGGLLVGGDVELKVWKTGGTGIKSDLETIPDMWPLKYEPGTTNLPGIGGLAASLEYILTQGIDQLAQKKADLSAHLCKELKKIKGITLYTDNDMENRCGVVSFTLSGFQPRDVGYILNESFDIRVRTGLHCAPLIHTALGTFPEGTIRISFSTFNHHDEVETFLGAIHALKGSA